jgi:simple sugar transport system permease protein
VIAGSLELAVPISLGAFAGILSERAACSTSRSRASSWSVRARVGRRERHRAASSSACSRRSSPARSRRLLLAWLGIRYKVDQIIAGVVINIGALGITNFLFLRVLSKNTELNTPPTIEAIQVPVLQHIPVLGRCCSPARRTLLHDLPDVLPDLHAVPDALGPALRASGEKPSAAGTVGIDVLRSATARCSSPACSAVSPART